MLLALDVDRLLTREKGLHVNSAGLCGALMRDIGFAPDAAAGFCLMYFVVPVLTHAHGAHWLRQWQTPRVRPPPPTVTA